MLTDNMAKIQVALEAGAVVRNEKGERIKLPGNSESGKRTDDCVKCYVNGTHWYWSSGAVQQEVFVNGQPFDVWFELQPLAI